MTDPTIDHLRSAVDAEYNYWKARAEAAEAEVKRLRAALRDATTLLPPDRWPALLPETLALIEETP